MTQKQKKILNLSVTIDEVQYVAGTLSEFSSFFTCPGDSPEIHLNCDTGEHTSRLDHITWHNRRIHIKRKDNVAFLAPSIDSTPEILMGVQFTDIPKGLSYSASLADLCDLKHRAGRIKVSENCDVAAGERSKSQP